MPRFPRLVVPKYPHHVTQRGVRKQTTFFDNADYRAYLRLATNLSKEYSVAVWAYCLMPNHIHAIVVPQNTDSLSKLFAALHRRYARRTNARHDWVGHLWQKRFYSVVMDETHAVSAMRYVELNPVRAGLCLRPEEWPWSSAKGNLGLTVDPLLDSSASPSIVSNWNEYLGLPEDTNYLERLRRQTETGRPDGDTTFVDSIESRTGRRVRPRRAGRKRK